MTTTLYVPKLGKNPYKENVYFGRYQYLVEKYSVT